MVSQISAKDTWATLQEKPNSVLVDVRTKEEIDFVGFVDVSEINGKTVFLPWKIYPNMTSNEAFVDDLSALINKTFPSSNPEEINLFFLCRSGSRSLEAALFMSDLGYVCYNITNGFEGHLDQSGHRGSIVGWKAENLPWRQK